MFCVPKKKKYILLIFQIKQKSRKASCSFMIPNREGWHYIAVKKLPALLRGITSKHHCDFYCLSCNNVSNCNNCLK